jgi:hypothetical protein
MRLNPSICDRIIESVKETPGCCMEDLVALFPDLTWSQVLWEVNQLHLGHRLLMIANGQGSFIISPTY